MVGEWFFKEIEPFTLCDIGSCGSEVVKALRY
jgi:hypothetical protein